MGVSDIVESAHRRESPSGYHYYSTYRNCPRSWYIKYVLGLRPQFTPPALIFGGAVHEALAEFYKNSFSIDLALRTFRRYMQDRHVEYEDADKFTDDLNRGPTLLQAWSNRWSEHDKATYRVLEVEEQHVVHLGPDLEFEFTVRPDRVLQNLNTRVVYVAETKTSSWSLQKAFRNAEMGDQVTSYIWAVRKTHPEWNVESAIIDVLYNKGKVFECDRPGTATRTKGDLAVFELGLYGTIVELTQKYLSLEHYPWPLLFPCNRNYCALFGCDYESVCSTNVQPGEVPPGFKRDDWSQDLKSTTQATQSFTLDALLEKRK